MYFAFDCLLPEFANKTMGALAALQNVHSGKPLSIFVLIDGAFDEEFLTKVFRTDLNRISLYEGTPLSSFGKSALFLVQIEMEQAFSTSWMGKLINASGGRPMWSLIVAAVDINKLAKHFAPFLIAKSDDSIEWPLRWGDTRVLPHFLNELEPKFIDVLLQPIYSWFMPSREGDLLSWCGHGRSEYEAAEYERLPIDEITFGKLLDTSEPDAVASQIHDRQPEFLRSLLPSECYRRIKRQLSIADRFNMRQPAVRQHFSTMALFLREDFLDLPALNVLLGNVRAGSDYMDEVGLLGDSFWEDALSN
jgi:hypothetical protein